MNGQIAIFTSQRVGQCELHGILSSFQQQYRTKQFARYSSDEEQRIDLALARLPTLGAFATVYQIGIVASAIDTSAYTPVLVQSLQVAAPSSQAYAWLSSKCWEGSPIPDSEGEFNFAVTAGMRREGYFCGVSTYQDSAAWNNPIARAALFRRALEAMGVTDSVQIAFDNEGYMKMTATEPLTIQFPSAQFGGLNATSFNVCGLSSLDDALRRARAVLEHLPSKILDIRFGAKFKPQDYEQVREKLNAVWKNGWTIDVLGSLSAEARRILAGGEPKADSPERIPAFTWWEGDFGPQVYGSIFVQNGKCYLEVAIDNGDEELLRKRLSVLQGVEFDRVEP